MVANGQGGSIINTASMLGIVVAKGSAAYSASKAGVISLTKTMALELARHGIRVNAICPGYFETEMTESYLATPQGQAEIKAIPMRRVGKAEELDGLLGGLRLVEEDEIAVVREPFVGVETEAADVEAQPWGGDLYPYVQIRARGEVTDLGLVAALEFPGHA